MGNTRDTQSVILALTTGTSNARVTQTAVLVLGKENPPIRDTQNVILVLAKEIVQPRITQAAVLVLAHVTPCVTQRAQCWKITRQDGQVFAYTTHDEVVNFGGTAYQPCDSLMASAIEQSDRTGGSVEMTGILSDDGITETDLFSGLFDGAKVEVWQVSWGDPSNRTDPPKRLAAGVIGNMSHQQTSFRADVFTAGARLQQRPLLKTYTPSCRWELGSTECGVNLAALQVSGSVTAGVSTRDAVYRTERRQFVDTARTETVGYFDGGVVTFTSGANNGRTARIKTHTAASAGSPQGGQFYLWAPLLNEIAVGDTYTMRPGCDKKKQTCKDKFNNFVNFGGFPDVPGNDALMQTPTAKA